MEIELHRKARLRELLDHSCGGVIAVLAQKIERNDSYVSRMLYPPNKAGAKPVGDKMMRVIEKAFSLPRAWFDMPMHSALPGADPVPSNNSVRLLAPDPGVEAHRVPRIVWPFRLVNYSRITALQRSMGPKLAQEALDDIDKYLDLAVMKWEREALAIKS